jgi:hypothetical protein
VIDPPESQIAATIENDENRAKVLLERDEIKLNHHRAPGFRLSMIFSENRCTLFRIML